MSTRKHVLVTVFCLSYLAIQVLIPLALLAAPRPARFGWHMWSVRVAFPRFRLLMDDGTSTLPDLGRYVVTTRGEIDLRDALPPHLCRVVSGVAAVEISAPDSDQRSEYSCR